SWGEHRIDRYHLEREGASFRATTQPVIAGGDHFRPAGIAVAPDGSLYVGDWADRSYPLHKKGRVWHITRRAADVSPRMRTTESGLRSADLRTRQDAARQLLAKGETGIAALKDAALDDADPRVRSIALATLVSGDVVTQDIADRALADQHEGVREQA